MSLRTLSAMVMLLFTAASLSVSQTRQKPTWAKVGRLSAGAAADWPAYGNDPGGSRYSPLAQINRGNVRDLKVAWTYRTGDVDVKARSASKAAFEATPIMVDGTLYLSTPFGRVIALDPETGKERWVYAPGPNTSANYSEVTSRGVSTWLDGRLKPGSACRRRIFVGTLDARLIALDAATGAPCKQFGTDGRVDLTRGVGLREAGQYQVTSPPAVVGDLLVVRSSVADNRGVEVERGVVRAYDARTGALRWSWDPMPQQAGLSAGEGGGAIRAGAATAWSIISADAARGLVFVPTSSPSPDFYGGERKGDNLYANSVVALRASTGRLVWHFQVVHHDLWDYDVAAQPVLVNFRRGARAVPAVVVATKMGHVFVLDRETGRPLLPVEERAVPPSTVPGEAASPTQPFPVLPRPVVPDRLRPEDAWGMTEADRDWCREKVRSLRSEGIFTPPSFEGRVMSPGNVGGVNWGGMTYDPARDLLTAATNRLATTVRLIPSEGRDKKTTSGEGVRLQGELGRMTDKLLDYREPLLSPGGAPCNPPPWGTLTAIRLSTGEVKWEVPLGTVPQLSAAPGSACWGSITLGGGIVTAGGLAFIGAAMDT